MMLGLGMGLSWIFWLVISGASSWGILGATNRSSNRKAPGESNSRSEAPMEVLETQYALGEIGPD